MGAAVIPIISQLIVSVVVSKVATAVAEKVGLSDSMASLIGLGAGMYAGSMVGGQAAGKPPGTTAELGTASALSKPPGQDLSVPTGPVQTATVPGGIGRPVGGAQPTPSPDAGMLNQGATPPPPQTPATEMTKTPFVSGDQDTAKTYWQKLFSPERIGDMAVAGIGGMAKASQAKEDRDYPEKLKRQNAAGWVAQDSAGQSKLAPATGPGYGYLSNYQ